MGRSLSIFASAVAGTALTVGCTASPWSAEVPANVSVSTETAGPSEGADSPETTGPPQVAEVLADEQRSQALQDVMADLQQMGTLDPAAREKLMADMRQTHPTVWPDMLRVSKGLAEYQRRAEQREKATGDNMTADAAHLPPVVSPPRPPDRPNIGEVRTTVAKPSPAAAKALPAPPRVSAVSHDCPAGPDWQSQLSGAIAALQSEIESLRSQQQHLQKTPESSHDAARKIKETLTAREAQLHLLYVLAGRREDAVRSIPEIDPAMQEFWTAQCCSLDTLLDVRRNPDSMIRARQAKRMLDDAVARLGETAPLVIRNLAFCTKIESYGGVEGFAKNEFTANQELLLYAEVENLTSESTPKGHHTSLRTSYQIFDSRNQRVADYQFTTSEDYCERPRRDYFMSYHLRLPNRIFPGKHTLQLTIEDLQSQKVGQSSIDLVIKSADD